MFLRAMYPVNCVAVTPAGSRPGGYDETRNPPSQWTTLHQFDSVACIRAFKFIHSGTAPVDVAFSIDWLPDGPLLVTSGPEGRLLRQQPDGALVDHADLAGLPFEGLNEIVVDGRGNVYVNGGNDFDPPEGVVPGGIALVTPDGEIRQVADRLAFPNGMAVTPDNKKLVTLLQSAAMQDSTSAQQTRTNTRLMVYDISQTKTPTNPVAEYVVQLPIYRSNGNGAAADGFSML